MPITLDLRGEKVWVLHIHHKHGDDYQAYASREGANDALAEWCHEWWEDTGEGEPPPINKSELIARYFDSEQVSAVEWAEINELVIGE